MTDETPPREPTQAMMRAGVDASLKFTSLAPMYSTEIAALWRAMWDAAPPAAPPAATNGPGREPFICPQRQRPCIAGCPYPSECPEPAAPLAAPTKPTADVLVEIDRVIERLQMDIDDGSRPDQWSMQSMQDNLRKALATIEQQARELAELRGATTRETPVAWRYVVNGAHILFDDAEPPDDAYDDGTLTPLYSAPLRELLELRAESRKNAGLFVTLIQRAERAEAERDALAGRVRDAEADAEHTGQRIERAVAAALAGDCLGVLAALSGTDATIEAAP